MALKKWPIPAGFVWSHEQDTYVHADGRTWDSEANIILPKGLAPATEHRKVASTDPLQLERLSTEELIIKEGATAPRVTPADVEAVIKEERYTRLSGTLMICELTLQNGFIVTGESACASPENYRESIGRDVSRKNATTKIWPLLGYELRTRLHEQQTVLAGVSGLRQSPDTY